MTTTTERIESCVASTRHVPKKFSFVGNYERNKHSDNFRISLNIARKNERIDIADAAAEK